MKFSFEALYELYSSIEWVIQGIALCAIAHTAGRSGLKPLGAAAPVERVWVTLQHVNESRANFASNHFNGVRRVDGTELFKLQAELNIFEKAILFLFVSLLLSPLASVMFRGTLQSSVVHVGLVTEAFVIGLDASMKKKKDELMGTAVTICGRYAMSDEEIRKMMEELKADLDELAPGHFFGINATKNFVVNHGISVLDKFKNIANAMPDDDSPE